MPRFKVTKFLYYLKLISYVIFVFCGFSLVFFIVLSYSEAGVLKASLLKIGKNIWNQSIGREMISKIWKFSKQLQLSSSFHQGAIYINYGMIGVSSNITVDQRSHWGLQNLGKQVHTNNLVG